MGDLENNYWLRRQLTRRRILQAGALGGSGLWASSLVGCNQTQTGKIDATPSGSASVGGAKPIDQVKIAIGEEPPGFDAHKASGAVYTYFTCNVNDGLVGFNTSGKLVPGLATSWTMLPNSKSYEFKLRQGVKFHNGDPFTAKDVEFSFKRMKDPKIQPRQSNMAHWQSLEVVDDYTVRIHLTKVDPTFLPYIGTNYRFNILPQKYIEKIGDDAFEKAPIGTGPYKFVRRAVKEFWELERFDDYWGSKAPTKKAIFQVIPEPTTMMAAFKTGEVDMVANYPPTFLEEVTKTPGVRFVKNLGGSEIMIKANTIKEIDPDTGKPNPYRDRRVRQAMCYAVDKDAIIKNLLKGMGEKVAVLFPEDVGYDPDLKPYPYDPAKAKQLLAEAGYPNGWDAVYYGMLGERIPMAKEVGEACAAYFTAIGIRTKVVNEEYALWLKRVTRESVGVEVWHMALGTSGIGGQFHTLYGFSANAGCNGTTSWYCNKELDAMTDQMYLETDQAKLEQMIKKAAKMFYDDAGVVYLYRSVISYIMKDWLDFTPTPNSAYVELLNLKAK